MAFASVYADIGVDSILAILRRELPSWGRRRRFLFSGFRLRARLARVSQIFDERTERCRVRTGDLRLRRPTLYPAELIARKVQQ